MPSAMRRTTAAAALLLVAMAAATAVLAATPSGGWTLKDPSPNVKDYHFRVDVDPGTTYPDDGFAPPSVYWAQYIVFEQGGQTGYLGMQRNPNQGTAKKSVLASIWDGIGAKGDGIPAVNCYEFGPCNSIHGEFEWFVGHVYRYRMELSPRTPSDEEGYWWMFSLTDLTTHTKVILGELKTPKAWGKLARDNGVFLEYFWGPDTCSTLRYNKVTEAPIAGNYGEAKVLASMSNFTYGDPHKCAPEYILTGMHPDEYGSLSLKGDEDSLILIGNTLRGVHKYGQFQKTAKAGMMFAMLPNGPYPYIFRAAHDGEYTAGFPAEGKDNADWISVGRGLPIINDLFFRKQRLYGWHERELSEVREGDFFSEYNPATYDFEYYILTKKEGAGYYPMDKTHDDHWHYVGRSPQADDDLTARLRVRTWAPNEVKPRQGAVYFSAQHDGDAYYILKDATTRYGAFPDRSKGEVDNQWWHYAGSKP